MKFACHFPIKAEGLDIQNYISAYSTETFSVFYFETEEKCQEILKYFKDKNIIGLLMKEWIA